MIQLFSNGCCRGAIVLAATLIAFGFCEKSASAQDAAQDPAEAQNGQPSPQPESNSANAEAGSKKPDAKKPDPKKAKAKKAKVRAPVWRREHDFRKYVKSWMEIRNQNIVMQARDYSCGAASLATLLRYHWGDNVSEEMLLREVIRMLNREEMVERYKNGLSLTDLRRLAVRTGYLSTIGRLEYDKLKESKVPLIVGVVVDGFDHFVVVRGADDYYVYIADPARGNVRTPIAEFVKQWQKKAVLVVVKKGVDPVRKSVLLVSDDDKEKGKTSHLYLRRRMTDVPKAPPQQP